MIVQNQPIPLPAKDLEEDLLTRSGPARFGRTFPFKGCNNLLKMEYGIIDIEDLLKYIKEKYKPFQITRVGISQDEDTPEEDRIDQASFLSDIPQSTMEKYLSDRIYAYSKYDNTSATDTTFETYKSYYDSENDKYICAAYVQSDKPYDANDENLKKKKDEIKKIEFDTLSRYLYLLSIGAGVHLISFAIAWWKWLKYTKKTKGDFGMFPLYKMKGKYIERRFIHEKDNKDQRYYPKYRDYFINRNYTIPEVKIAVNWVMKAKEVGIDIENIDPRDFGYEFFMSLEDVKLDNYFINGLMKSYEDERLDNISALIEIVMNNLENYNYNPLTLRNVLYYLKQLDYDSASVKNEQRTIINIATTEPLIINNGKKEFILFCDGLLVNVKNKEDYIGLDEYYEYTRSREEIQTRTCNNYS